MATSLAGAGRVRVRGSRRFGRATVERNDSCRCSHPAISSVCRPCPRLH